MLCGPSRSGSATRSESHFCGLHQSNGPIRERGPGVFFRAGFPSGPSLSPSHRTTTHGMTGGEEKVSVSKQYQREGKKIETGRISRGGVGLDPAAGPRPSLPLSLPPPRPGRRPSLPRRRNPGLSVVGGNGRRVDGEGRLSVLSWGAFSCQYCVLGQVECSMPVARSH